MIVGHNCTSTKIITHPQSIGEIALANNTFPRIRGTKRVETRLLNISIVGIETPAPVPMNLERENGT